MGDHSKSSLLTEADRSMFQLILGSVGIKIGTGRWSRGHLGLCRVPEDDDDDMQCGVGLGWDIFVRVCRVA